MCNIDGGHWVALWVATAVCLSLGLTDTGVVNSKAYELKWTYRMYVMTPMDQQSTALL